MFGNGRARSGIVVLPCGAGKSLTGVTAASTVKKSTVILCINNVSVKQWKDQLLQWTTIPEDRICLFTAQHKEQLPPANEACIVLTTYTMLCFSGQRAEAALPIIQSIQNREWGLLILDEVHVAPATKFRTVLHLVNAHCKMGLTATLVREDDLIEELNFLIGPKLYEANWMDLTQQGYLANVQCCEIWCPMTAEFYREYLRPELKLRISKLMYIMNPNKFRCCEYLVNYHEARGDKIIIFSDDVIALKIYCEALNRPYIYGETTEDERKMWLNGFKLKRELNCIGLSKVGDTALDIPEANVIIQISSHFGARRQEAQRLGRILRPKLAQLNGFITTTYNAFFYTLVSCDTREMYFSTKRQQYLVDQGYTFKVIQDLIPIANEKSLLLKTKYDEMNLLNKILNIDLTLDEREDRAIAVNYTGDDEGPSSSSSTTTTGRQNKNSNSNTSNLVKRKNIKLNELSNNGNDISYNEYTTDIINPTQLKQRK